jgi:hypothetical protein
MKLPIAVGDVGQAPKVEDLAQSEGADRDGELTGPPVMRQVASATVEPESHLMLPSTWCASCHGVKTVANMLFKSVSKYKVSGGSGGLKNTRITQRRRNGVSWFGPIWSLHLAADDPYTQEHPKSRGYNRV